MHLASYFGMVKIALVLIENEASIDERTRVSSNHLSSSNVHAANFVVYSLGERTATLKDDSPLILEIFQFNYPFSLYQAV